MNVWFLMKGWLLRSLHFLGMTNLSDQYVHVSSDSSDASPEHRQKLLEAVRAGRVEYSDEGKKYFERAGGIALDPDFSLVEVSVESFWGPFFTDHHANKGGVCLNWSSVSAGWGQITLYLDREGKLHLDAQCMSRKFCLEVIEKLLEQAEEDCPPRCKT